MLDLRDSSTYRETLQEGMAAGLQEGKAAGLQEGSLEEGRRVLLRLGQKRFGAAPAEAVQRIEAMTNVGQLEALIDRVLEAEGWNDLMG